MRHIGPASSLKREKTRCCSCVRRSLGRMVAPGVCIDHDCTSTAPRSPESAARRCWSPQEPLSFGKEPRELWTNSRCTIRSPWPPSSIRRGTRVGLRTSRLEPAGDRDIWRRVSRIRLMRTLDDFALHNPGWETMYMFPVRPLRHVWTNSRCTIRSWTSSTDQWRRSRFLFNGVLWIAARS